MNRIFYAIIFGILSFANILNAQIGVNFGSGMVSTGQTVDVDVTLDDFENIILMQFSVNWDPNDFIFNDILNLSTTLPEFSAGNIGTPSAPAVDEGQLTLSWNKFDTSPESLPDDHRLFTIRLEAVGNPCGETPIDVSNIPRIIELL